MTFGKVKHLLGKVTIPSFAKIYCFRKIEQIMLFAMNNWEEFVASINVGYVHKGIRLSTLCWKM